MATSRTAHVTAQPPKEFRSKFATLEATVSDTVEHFKISMSDAAQGEVTRADAVKIYLRLFEQSSGTSAERSATATVAVRVVADIVGGGGAHWRAQKIGKVPAGWTIDHANAMMRRTASLLVVRLREELAHL